MTRQVWQWSSFQRRSDSLMNKAFIRSCQRLVERAFELNPNATRICDVGAGSGLVLRHLNATAQQSFSYHAIDLSKDGLELLRIRAKKLGLSNQVSIVQDDVSKPEPFGEGQFDAILSHFCVYTINDKDIRHQVFQNIFRSLKPSGTAHIAVPSDLYGAGAIARQCLIDEIQDDQLSLPAKVIRAGLLVPYQWRFVLGPIAARVDSGEFVRFSAEQIRNEVSAAGLVIEDLHVDYGGCGYHLHARRPQE